MKVKELYAELERHRQIYKNAPKEFWNMETNCNDIFFDYLMGKEGLYIFNLD